MAFGEKLLAWRRYRGLTQAVLADRARIPQPNIAALENGRLDPRLSTLERLAISLGISAGDLLDRPPPSKTWSRQRIDALVREAIQPQRALRQRLAAALRIVASEKLIAAGQRVTRNGRTGERLVKQLRAELGKDVWESIVGRLNKLI